MAAKPKTTRWERKAAAEAMNPDFPMLDPKAISIEDYRAAVQKLLADASIPQPQFTLTWRDLSVSVPVAPPSGPENVFVAFSGCAAAIRNGCANMKHPFADADPGDLSKGGGGRTHVLDSVNGRLEPGDTCLVLGPSGSGSSLLLRRLAGRHIGVGSEESGEVLYDGEKKLAGIVKPAHIVGFVGQDDVHTPELTVRDTLKFAADCKYPEYYPYVSVLRKNHIDVMADILGITRVLDTIVGDESLRGCSGGERKRVTIAEMVVSSQNGLLCLDNWSKGLDATTVLNICKSIRDYAARAKTIIVASMGAPGTDSFNTFSHLAVLDAGKLLYFGRRDEADAYFTGIGFVRPPERSVPDFISTISDPTVNGEYLRAGVDRGTIPTTPAGLEAHFKESDHGDALLRSLNEPIERKGPGVDEVPGDIVRLAQERSLQTWAHQFVSVGKRQLRVLSAKKKQFIAQVVINIIFGVILGSIFWQLPKTQGGATSRGGAIFLTSLYFGINALSQIPQMAVDKQVHLKHSASFFYMSLPYVVSLLAYDLATGLVRAVAFVVPLWLMAGMELGSGGERLLFAVLTVWQVTIIFGNFARFMVNTFDNAHAAQAISGLMTIILILTAGFLKSRGDLQAYLIWVYWMDPLHYALEALLLNEFDGLVLSCTTGELLPDNPLIADEFRICLVSTGEKYLADNFSITEGAIYRLYYFCILSAYVVVFMILAAIAVRTSKPKSFAAQAKKDAKIPEAFRSSDSVSIAVEAGDHPIPTRMTFKDMVYSVENGSKQLLSKVSGVVPPHQMIALVGTSGAGKSTLLDCVAFRKTLKKGSAQSGEVRINGNPVSKKEMAYTAGYCEQDDTHVPQSTVRESVRFAAMLRLPASLSENEKNRKVTKALERLGLLPFSDVVVKALGASEKKLLTMALELVAEPTILFLDEPTSGLSLTSSLKVVNAMRAVRDSGTGVICTIHQPSQEIFQSFDRLLLLQRGGKTVYYGEISDLPQYFVERGQQPVAPEANVADWMLDCVADESRDWHQEWNDSDLRRRLDEEVVALSAPDEGGRESLSAPNRVSFFVQARECIKRQLTTYYRMPEYNFTRVLLQTLVGVIVGLLYLREIDDTQQGARLLAAAAFLSVIPSNLSVQNIIPVTVAGRLPFYREIASNTYAPLAHHISIGVAEIPFAFVATTVFTVIFYFMIGLDPGSFWFFYILNQIFVYMTLMIGNALGSISPTKEIGMIFSNILIILFTTLSGFLIRRPELPSWWGWTVWINPYAYYLAAVLRNAVVGKTFTCSPEELGTFALPTGVSSCADVPGAPGGSGYAVSDIAADLCSFCPIPDGATLLESYSATISKWWAVVAILVWILACRVVAGIGFGRLRYITR